MKLFFTLAVSITLMLTTYAQVVSTVIQQTSVSCNGLCDGTAVIVTTGGQPPYIISGPAANAPQTYTSVVTLTGICAGTTTFLVTDALNQTTPVIIFINQPFVLTLNSSETHETINGICDGQIVTSVTGGTPPYAYSLNGGTPQGFSTFGNLCAGTYSVCVMDANGCTTCETAIINAGMVGCQLSSTVVQQSTLQCNGDCNGTAVITTTGGQMPYTATGSFTNSPAIYTSMGTLAGLCGGTNVVTITDNMGCTSQLTLFYNEPTQLLLTNNQVNETVNGACDGQIIASVSGGTSPYTYTINGGSAQGSNTFGNLCAGTYSVCVIDANGCTVCETVTINAGTSGCQLSSTVVQQSTLQCNGDCNGTAVITTTGGQMPYTATGSFTNSPAIYTSMGTLAGLCGGTNVVTITDNMGCTSQLTLFYNEPTQLQVATSIVANISAPTSCDGVIVGTVAGGTPGYMYSWIDCTTQNNISTQSTAGNVCAGDYALEIVDMNGCTVTSSCLTLSATSEINELESVFNFSIYPNPSNGNVIIKFNTPKNHKYELSVYDVNGRSVYVSQISSEFQSLDLTDELSDGIYTMVVNSSNYNAIQKLVIQK